MSNQLSQRALQLEPSATMAVSARAKALSNAGKDVISLGVGEPDFDTPDFIKEAAYAALAKGITKYTAVDGLGSLKKAIAHKLQRDNQLHYELEQIIATVGVKSGLYDLAQVVLNPGDEVIVPAPYWVSYPPIVKLAGAKPVIITTRHEQNFKITPAQLAAAITPKTRLCILNSPNNPSGMVYSAQELKSLAEVLLAHPSILIATDDIYEYIVWDQDTFVNILNVCPQLAERTVVFNGLSKAYAMTGWRVGYAAGPGDVIAAMKKIQSQNITCVNSIAQMAATTALQAERSQLSYMVEAFKQRHAVVYNALNAMQGVTCLQSNGTFYLLPSVAQAMQRLDLPSDIELANYLLDEAHVAVVPGTAFGAPGYVRISIATSMEKLQQAMQRLSTLFNA